MPDWSLSSAIPDALDCPGCGLAQSWLVLVGYETDEDGHDYRACEWLGHDCSCDFDEHENALVELAMDRYDPD